MKDKFTLGCIVKKPQPLTSFQSFWALVGTLVLSDWLGFLGVLLLIGSLTCMIFKISLACVILLSVCLVISLLRLIINKDNRTYHIKIFNVIVTIILLISQIFIL